MRTRPVASARRWTVIPAVLALVAGGLVLGAAPVAADDPEPQTYTTTYDCRPGSPGYGTHTYSNAMINVRIGDTIRVVLDGGGCREGSMHSAGDLSMFETTPAWSGSCCTYVPSGTVYTMKVVKYAESRYGKGYQRLSWFRDNYASMHPTGIIVAPPTPVAPAAPPLLRATTNETSAYIYYDTAFFDGYSPITAYEWRIVSPAETAWRSEAPNAGKVIVAVNLKLGTKYTVEVRARNIAGTGPSSTIGFATRAVPPGPPTNLEADPGDGEATISFTPGVDGGSDIRGYQYQVDGGDWQDAGTNSSPVRISGLENGRTYDVRLRALNETETGTASATVRVETGPGTADITICHADGDAFETVTVAASARGGLGDHDGHGSDIVPDHPFVPGGRNLDDEGSFILANGCQGPELEDADEDGLTDLEDADDDGDGLRDDVDLDDDGDGIQDCDDPDHEYATDSDGDGIPNAFESDDDGDGIADVVDPDGDGDGVRDVEDGDRALPADADSDGVPDALDADDDGDCIADDRDSDRDGDGYEDSVDTDLDNDGIPNAEDADIDGDGSLNVADADSDGDTVADAGDGQADDGDRASRTTTCDPANGGLASVVPGAPAAAPLRVPVDTDGDGVPNVRDADDDGDGIADAVDRDADGDGVRDVVDGDANGDGRPEARDQPLATAFALPELQAGQEAVLVGGPLRTVAGQRATVRVDCTVAGTARAAGAVVPTGDVAGPRSGDLCRTTAKDGRLRIVVAGDYPTLVTVRVSAPATGEYRPLSEAYTAIVR